MTTPEQLAKWRTQFETAYSEHPEILVKRVGGDYIVGTVLYAWAGYLRRCQESEQIMKLAKFGAEVLNELVGFESIDIADVCMFAAQGDLLTDDGKVAPNIETTIKELLND